MDILIYYLTTFWYIWVLIILAAIVSPYLPKIKGYFGEKSVALFLSRLDPAKYKTINNIMLQTGKGISQIDHVIVSSYGIFVIETKNYKGWIIGNELDDYWIQVIYKRKEKLRNPIKQNYGHIQALKGALNDYPDINYILIAAFTTKADLKVNVKTDVVYTVNLLKTIKRYNIETISNSIKNQIYTKLISININSKENRKTHIKAIKDNLTGIQNKIDSNICPKCGGKLINRKGRYGMFTGCANYPKCRFIAK